MAKKLSEFVKILGLKGSKRLFDLITHLTSGFLQNILSRLSILYFHNLSDEELAASQGSFDSQNTILILSCSTLHTCNFHPLRPVVLVALQESLFLNYSPAGSSLFTGNTCNSFSHFSWNVTLSLHRLHPEVTHIWRQHSWSREHRVEQNYFHSTC